MVYTRKKTPIPFVPIAYTPPKRRRRKNLLEVYKENTESIPIDTIVIGEELTAVAMGKETESPVLDKEKASDVQELTATDPEFAQVFATEMVADIMSKCRIERATDPPRIPLCRILRNEAVRAVSRSDIRMREILRNDGYLPEKGKFVLSMKSSKGSDVPVTDSIRSKWDDYWIDVNEDFERELQESEEWKDLSGKMFLCWDGNHRTAGWMEEIRYNHLFCYEKSRHIRVEVSFIDVEKCHVQQLISALNRVNELNEDGVVQNTMKDTIYSVHKIATASPEQYLSKLDAQYLATMKIKDGVASNTGTEQWYQLPRLAYCKILFQRQLDKEIAVELAAAKDTDDKEALKTVATRKVQDKWVTKMGKLLAIVNPALGPSWLDAVTRAEFDPKTTRLTIEKLLEMVKAKVPNEIRDRWVQWMSSGGAIQCTYGIPKGDKSFKDWIKKEVWLEHLVEKASDVYKETTTLYHLQIEVPHNGDIDNWFRTFKLKNIAQMFKPYHKHMSATVAITSSYEIDKSSRRLVYRYYKYLMNEKIIATLPAELDCWKTSDENGMYSKKGNLDRPGGLTEYEMQNCPWWIDYAFGEYPSIEEEEYKSNVKAPTLKRKVDSSGKKSTSVPDPTESTEVKKKKRKQDKSNASASKVIELETSDASLEETVPPFDITKVVASTSIEMQCGDILQTSEQYSKKVDAPVFKDVRDFAKTHAREQHVYKRNASVREWGFELVIIDFPTNNFRCEDDSEIPPWNLCTIPFVQACFSFGTLCLDDDGWLVSVYSVEQAKVIEKEARWKCLELFRTYFLHQDIPFGIVKDRMGSLACKVLLVSIWTRKGTSPSIQNILDKSKKGLPCQEQSLDHYFERGSKLHSSPSTPSRKSCEKSISFMEFIIENFCPKEGLVLDMLSGTGSALIASAILSRHCYGIDNDKLLVDHVKSSRLSALASSSSSKVERNLFEDSDDEVAAEDEEPM